MRARAAANDWGSQITSEPRAQYRPTGGLTPLLYAARSGCTECVRAILAAGEDVDRPTPDGVTALMLAIDNYEFDTAKALLDAGANPHLSDWWGRTALYLAVDMNSYVPRGGAAHPRSKNTTGMDLVNALLAAGVEVNPQLNFHRPGRGGNSARFVDDLLTTGATPLLRAAIMHDDEAMRALLAAGARVDLPNVMGVTPLMAAAGIGVREPGFGANRAPDFTSKTIESEVIASLEILLAAGADVNAAITDLQSRTARIARAELDDGSAGADGAALGGRPRLGRGRRVSARARREPGVERQARPHAARSRDDARAGPPRAELGAHRRAAEGRRRHPDAALAAATRHARHRALLARVLARRRRAAAGSPATTLSTWPTSRRARQLAHAPSRAIASRDSRLRELARRPRSGRSIVSFLGRSPENRPAT